MKPLAFMSKNGRIYGADEVRPVVLAILRKRWRPVLRPGWLERVDALLTDPAWLRSRNGYTPAALAGALEDAAIFPAHTQPPAV